MTGTIRVCGTRMEKGTHEGDVQGVAGRWAVSSGMASWKGDPGAVLAGYRRVSPPALGGRGRSGRQDGLCKRPEAGGRDSGASGGGGGASEGLGRCCIESHAPASADLLTRPS